MFRGFQLVLQSSKDAVTLLILLSFGIKMSILVAIAVVIFII